MLVLIAACVLAIGFTGIPAMAWIHGNAGGGGGGSCWNPLSPDANGWTVICSTPVTTGTCAAGTANGTCFVAITDASHTPAGNDGTCISSEVAATAEASPCLTIQHGMSLVSAHNSSVSSDHLLLQKGAVWVDQSFGGLTFSGVDAAHPALIGSYGTGARPLVKTKPLGDSGCVGSAGSGGGGNDGNFIAFIGINCYNYTRDPANIGAGFDPSDNDQGGTFFSNPYQWLLLEDNKFSFYVNDINIDADTTKGLPFPHLNTYIRRNIIVDAWTSGTGHAQGIHAGLNYGDLLFEENVFDMDGWLASLVLPVTATVTIANPAVVTGFAFSLPDTTQIAFTNNGDTLPTGLALSTAYFAVDAGTDGVGTIRLSNGTSTPNSFGMFINGCTPTCTTFPPSSNVAGTTLTVNPDATFTGSISGGTNLTTGTVTGTIGIGDTLDCVSCAALTHIVSGSGTTWVVDVSQSVSSQAMSTAALQGGVIAAGYFITGGQSGASIAVLPGTHIVSGKGLTWTVDVSQNYVGAAGTVGPMAWPEIATSGSQSGTHKVAWDQSGYGPQATIFNHCIYLDSQNSPNIVRGNIISNCSLTGLQGRDGGEFYHNLVTLSPEVGFDSNVHDNVSIAGSGHPCPSTVGCPPAEANAASIGGPNGTMTNNLVTSVITPGGAALFTGDSHDDCGRILFSISNPAVITFTVAGVPNNGAFSFSDQAGVFDCDGSGVPPSSFTALTPYYIQNPAPDTHGGTNTAGYTANASTTPGGALISTAAESTSGIFAPLSYSYGGTVTGNTVYSWGNSTGDANIQNSGVLSSTNNFSSNINFNAGGGSFADPGRSIGSYYAHIGGTAHATFTGSQTGTTLTVTGLTGTLSNFDAVTGSFTSGGTNNEYINDATHCTPACSGGSYTMSISQGAGSQSMSAFSTADFLAAARLQSKDSWNTGLMAINADIWIAAGFGMTIH